MFPLKRRALVGLFVLGGFLLFGVGLFWIGNRRLLFARNVEFATEFTNLGSLKAGSKVYVSGMEAGEVLSIQVPQRPGAKFRVRFRVLDDFRPILRTDSIATIQVEGLVGSKILQVEAGTAAGAPLEPGAIVPSREPVEIGQLIEQAAETVREIDRAVDDIHQQVVVAVNQLTAVGHEAEMLVKDVGADAREVVATSKSIIKDVDAVVGGVRQGRGTVGKLLTDDAMYEKVRDTVGNIEAVTGNARAVSDNLVAVTDDLRRRNIGEKVEAAVTNVQDATGQVKKAIEAISPAQGGDSGLFADVRGTLQNTREATADLADNMEALKHNWFFRGFFKKRGFYDIDSISIEEYRKGDFARGRDAKREWLESPQLFVKDAAGNETLSAEGKAALDRVAVPYLKYAADTPLIVEGYASQGTEEEQFLRSRDRARLVRSYLVTRFGLKPQYVGAIPLGAVRSQAPSGEFWDGVALAYFPKK
ncbi:MAG: MlaD family protein [bacterium]|jgi:phospholipid/cholesterol/gamma-HCH transport system substrate-binding protein